MVQTVKGLFVTLTIKNILSFTLPFYPQSQFFFSLQFLTKFFIKLVRS